MDRQQLLHAIAAQERLRGSLPDEIVDTAVAALRAQLDAIDATQEMPERRGQATVLFADVAGFTRLSERMDAELVARLMNELWIALDDAISRHGGHIDKHIGDAVMGVWGTVPPARTIPSGRSDLRSISATRSNDSKPPTTSTSPSGSA